MHKRRIQFQQLFINILIVFCLSSFLWLWTPSKTSKPECKLKHNAAWESADWTSYLNNESEIQQIAESAEARNLDYLFLYVSYLQPDGSFSQSYTYSHDFIDSFRKYNEKTKLLAWIGLPLKNNRTIGVQGWVDLSDPNIRQKIVKFVGGLSEDFGFDGVHINAETVQNNDLNYLSFLDEIRLVIGKDKVLSIAASHWVPNSLNLLPILRDFRWTWAYYQEVGLRVQQIVTMSYDSYAFHPALYRLWVREQVKGNGVRFNFLGNGGE